MSVSQQVGPGRGLGGREVGPRKAGGFGAWEGRGGGGRVSEPAGRAWGRVGRAGVGPRRAGGCGRAWEQGGVRAWERDRARRCVGRVREPSDRAWEGGWTVV